MELNAADLQLPELHRLYELSLAISDTGTLRGTAERGLAAYVEALGYRGGAVLEQQDVADGIDLVPVATESDRPKVIDSIREDLDVLPRETGELAQFQESLPKIVHLDGEQYHLLDLPGYGVLVLIAGESAPEVGMLRAIDPINEKLATACRRNRDAEGGLRDGLLDRVSAQNAVILDAEGREAICNRAVRSVPVIFDGALAVILRYDRSQGALVLESATHDIERDRDASSEASTDGTGLQFAYRDQSTTAWDVFLTGRPARIDRPETDDGVVSDLHLVSGRCVPIGSHGVLIIGSREERIIDETDASFAPILASVIENALDRAERERGLKGVQEITREILTAESKAGISETVLELLPDRLDLPISAIWEWDSGQEALVPIGSTQAAADVYDELSTIEASDHEFWVAYHDQEAAIHRHGGDQAGATQTDETGAPAVRSEIVVPIGDFGVLATASSHPGSFTRTERRLLETLGGNVETALRLVNQREELQLQDQVLARILRHNIRNELTAVQGFAIDISERSEGGLKESAEMILDRCSDLQRTANHAREMQTVVRRSDERTIISLKQAVGHAIKSIQTEYPDATINAYLEADTEVSAHPIFSTAVRHLIDNGIVHHPAYTDDTDETPEVAIRVFQSDDGVGVSVSDTGEGIPRNEIEVLDTHGETSLRHGSGVGLWIVDRIVAYSGADLTFETGEDGTTVTICFDQ